MKRLQNQSHLEVGASKSVNRGRMKIVLREIAGLASALDAMRLPMKSHDKSDSEFMYSQGKFTGVAPGKADILLMSKLVKAGDEHGKALRGIIVWADITAPRYWWQEMDTYRMGTEGLSSESTMHSPGMRKLSGKALQEAKAAITEGTEQRRYRTFGYQCLRHIYHQRRNHRLPEWKQFCKWIEGLPYALEFVCS